jgi:hypothetical protein
MPITQTYQGCVGTWALVNGVLSFAIFDFRVGSLQSPNPMLFGGIEDPLMAAVIVAAKGQAVDVDVDEGGNVVAVRSAP